MDCEELRIRIISHLTDFYTYYVAVKFVDEIPDEKLLLHIQQLNDIKEQLKIAGDTMSLTTPMAKLCYNKMAVSIKQDNQVNPCFSRTQEEIDSEMRLIKKTRNKIALDMEYSDGSSKDASHQHLLMLMAKGCEVTTTQNYIQEIARADAYATSKAKEDVEQVSTLDSVINVCSRFNASYRKHYTEYKTKLKTAGKGTTAPLDGKLTNKEFV